MSTRESRNGFQLRVHVLTCSSGIRFSTTLYTVVDGTVENPFPLQRSQILNTGTPRSLVALRSSTSPFPPQRHLALITPFPLHTSQTTGTTSVTSVHFSQSDGRTARERLAQYGALPHGYETLRMTCLRGVSPVPLQLWHVTLVAADREYSAKAN